MAIQRDFQFAHWYEVEEIPELPGNGRFRFPVHYFPGSKTRPEHDGIWLTVRPGEGEPWIGVFAFGYGSPPACSRVLSLPDPKAICIVSRGTAYVVQASDPARWEKLEVFPVTHAIPVPEAGLVVFADFTRLSAFGQNGVAWTSPSLCWDALKIMSIDSQKIEGVGYDPGGSGECDLPFAVDLPTGRALTPLPPHLNRPPYS